MSDHPEVDRLLDQMTLDEKIAMVHGSGPFQIAGCARLGIPEMRLSDGPAGCTGPHMGPTLVVPQETALAATFDTAAVREIAELLGQESVDSGVDMLLAPTVNLHRSPLAGRHFECFSEDPYLSARMAVAYVDGLQSTGVSACVKHLVANDQEHERTTIDAQIDERTLREVYLQPFEAAVVEADARSVMAAYNFVNGHHATAQPHVLTEILKQEWGFDGVVVSDWGALKETVAPALHGTDLEMPGPGVFWGGGRLRDAVDAGEVPIEVIDDKVRRLLRLQAWRGRLQAPTPPDPMRVERPERSAVARRVAADAMVLVRNDGILPLAPGRTVAVIGPCGEFTSICGGGSAHSTPYRETSVLQSMQARWSGEVRGSVGIDIRRRTPSLPYSSAPGGVRMEVFAGSECSGTPIAVEDRLCVYNVLHSADFGHDGPLSVRLAFTLVPEFTGPARLLAAGMGTAIAFLDGVAVATNAGGFNSGMGQRGGTAEIEVEAGHERSVVLEVTSASDSTGRYMITDFGITPSAGVREATISAAEQVAAASDIVVLVVGSSWEWESEGGDRADLALPAGQDELVRRVLAANPRTVVVLNTGAPVAMPWFEDAAAVLVAWYGGQEAGEAIVDVLTGEAEPGGRMPTTWAKELRDTPSFLHYPGEAGVERYGEELWVGHRWYDARGIAPLIPFGHGGSYTTFSWGPSSLHGEGVEVVVEVPVTNTGSHPGSDVVQLYVESRCSPVLRPLRQLAGFAKVRLQAGETGLARIALDRRSFARWDVASDGWMVDPGEYRLVLGASAIDLRSELTHVLEAAS